MSEVTFQEPGWLAHARAWTAKGEPLAAQWQRGDTKREASRDANDRLTRAIADAHPGFDFTTFMPNIDVYFRAQWVVRDGDVVVTGFEEHHRILWPLDDATLARLFEAEDRLRRERQALLAESALTAVGAYGAILGSHLQRDAERSVPSFHAGGAPSAGVPWLVAEARALLQHLPQGRWVVQRYSSTDSAMHVAIEDGGDGLVGSLDPDIADAIARVCSPVGGLLAQLADEVERLRSVPR